MVRCTTHSCTYAFGTSCFGPISGSEVLGGDVVIIEVVVGYVGYDCVRGKSGVGCEECNHTEKDVAFHTSLIGTCSEGVIDYE